MEDKIILTADDGTDVTFYVIEETRLGASNYLLVADSDDEDAECLILKDTSRDEDPEAVYELVEDETELDAVSKVFCLHLRYPNRNDCLIGKQMC